MALGGETGETNACHCLCLTVIMFIMLGGFLGFESYYRISAHCTGVLLWPMLYLFIFLLVLVILALVAMLTHDNDDGRCVPVGLVGMSLVIVALAAFIIFGYVAVGGSNFSPAKVREYNLTEYKGSWLKRRFADPQRWARISACISHRHACDGMKDLVRDPKTGIYIPLWRWENSSRDNKDGPKPIEFGCCMPPTSCGFTYVNGTTWVPAPGKAVKGTNADDCSRWSSDQHKLCFQCDSRKAALLDENRKIWTKGVAFPITTLVLLIALFYSLVKTVCGFDE